jgi:hypothetical protein
MSRDVAVLIVVPDGTTKAEDVEAAATKTAAATWRAAMDCRIMMMYSSERKTCCKRFLQDFERKKG